MGEMETMEQTIINIIAVVGIAFILLGVASGIRAFLTKTKTHNHKPRKFSLKSQASMTRAVRSIQPRREALNLSIPELADLANCSRTTLTKYERNRTASTGVRTRETLTGGTFMLKDNPNEILNRMTPDVLRKFLLTIKMISDLIGLGELHGANNDTSLDFQSQQVHDLMHPRNGLYQVQCFIHYHFHSLVGLEEERWPDADLRDLLDAYGLELLTAPDGQLLCSQPDEMVWYNEL
jgi:transcriptional regulator with XRE-family HTH domain